MRQDSFLVNMFQGTLNVPVIIRAGEEKLQLMAIVFSQLGQDIFLNILVHGEIRLVICQQAILFFLDLQLVLVDGKVKRSLEKSILPGRVDVKLIVELALLWHEVCDDGYGHDKNKAFVQQILV